MVMAQGQSPLVLTILNKENVMKSIKKSLIFLFIIIVSVSCGNSSKVGNGNGRLALAITNNVDFDPNVDHSRIDCFVVSIDGDGIETSVKQKFGFDTESVTFEGLNAGETVNVTVEAVNYNGYAILRGVSEDVMVGEDNTTVSKIEVKAVPVFANVYHNATVYSNRFVPKIYAPTNVEFDVVDLFNGSESVLEDLVCGAVDFSVNASDTNSVKTVYAAPLPEGTQQLTVQDTDTGESTQITINVIDSGQVKALQTTAGAYVGSMMSVNPYYQASTLESFFEHLIQ